MKGTLTSFLRHLSDRLQHTCNDLTHSPLTSSQVTKRLPDLQADPCPPCTSVSPSLGTPRPGFCLNPSIPMTPQGAWLSPTFLLRVPELHLAIHSLILPPRLSPSYTWSSFGTKSNSSFSSPTSRESRLSAFEPTSSSPETQELE